MNRFLIFSLALGAIASSNAAVLRVNNAANTAAQFSNVADALGAAQDGDVIILEPSSESYGNFDVKVKVTIKGGGYFLDVNDVTNEGAASTKAADINIFAAGTTITGIECNKIAIAPGANDVIITRNRVTTVSLGGTFGYDITDENAVAGTIIHQNLVNFISGPQYGAKATGIQITNNIITYSPTNTSVYKVKNSVIRYNTYGNDDSRCYGQIDNSVFEYNLGGSPEKSDSSVGNSYNNNHPGGSYKLYGTSAQYNLTDSKFKEVDATLSTQYGAFAGETPYVLSGVPSGPVIIDLELPNSVTKGEDLRVSVTVGVQK